jgi:hypothetical protein
MRGFLLIIIIILKMIIRLYFYNIELTIYKNSSNLMELLMIDIHINFVAFFTYNPIYKNKTSIKSLEILS